MEKGLRRVSGGFREGFRREHAPFELGPVTRTNVHAREERHRNALMALPSPSRACR